MSNVDNAEAAKIRERQAVRSYMWSRRNYERDRERGVNEEAQ